MQAKMSSVLNKNVISKTPQGWMPIKLGEYLNELSERHNSSSNNNIPILSVTNKPGFVVSEEFFDRKVFSKDLSKYKIIHKGQFAYNPSRVNVGSIARLKEFDKGLLSPMYVVFETKDGLEGSYLDYWISSQRFRNLVKASTQGSVRDSLSFSALAEFPFNLPPEKEQKKIVSILSCVDSVIDKTQAIIAQTQTLKKALMQKLFTRGIPGRHKKFKKTEIGEIPEEWGVIKLGSVCISKPEYGANVSAKDYDPTLPRYIRITDLSESGELLKTNRRSIDKEFASEYLLSEGDLLFARSGATVGKTYLYNKKDGLCAFAGYLIRFRVDNNKLLPKFLFYFTHSPHYYQWVKGMFRAGAQPNINATEYNRLTIPLPNIEEQQEIIDVLKSLEDKVQLNKDIINRLLKFKSALMQVLLSGEVRVKVYHI